MPPSPLRVYLAGPMRGIPNFNFPLFDFATAQLRARGFFVFSPAERDREAYGADIEFNPTGAESAVSNPACTIRDCMKVDTAWICGHADVVALLPGWEKSSGARAELALAEALGLTTMKLGNEYLPDAA